MTKISPLPATQRSSLTEGMSDELHISYQVTVVANLMAFGGSPHNVKRFGINLREWRVLGAIGRLGPLTAKQMSDAVHQDKATISRAIADLEKKGIIVKLPNKSHKRSPLIWMAEEGKALYDNIVPTFTEQASQFTNVLSGKEKNQLCGLLDKLKNHIELVKDEQGLS